MSDLLINNEDFMLNALLDDGFDDLYGANKQNDKYFAYRSIQNVPFVEYPDMTKEENTRIWLMAKETMLQSKKNNDCNEVAITFDYKQPGEVISFGDINKVNLLTNEKVMKMLNDTDALTIINLHNHTNYSTFSFRDAAIFAYTNKIRIMEVINPNGNLSILYRNENSKDVSKMLGECILTVVPDFKKTPELSNINQLTAKQLTDITSLFFERLKECRVIYIQDVTKLEAKDISAKLKTDVELLAKTKSSEQKDIPDTFDSLEAVQRSDSQADELNSCTEDPDLADDDSTEGCDPGDD